MKYTLGFGAVVEQRPGDRDRVVRDRLQRKPREAEVRQRLPAFRSPVPLDQIAFAADVRARRVGLAVQRASPSPDRRRAPAFTASRSPQTTAV